MTQKQTFENNYDSFYSDKMTASNRARGNELKFLISAQQLFKWLRYRYLKIWDGHLQETNQTKLAEFGPIVILVSIQLYRHLKHQNLSTSDDFSHSSRIFLLPFWPPGRKWGHFKMILSCQADLNGYIDTSNSKIYPLVMILLMVVE